MHEGGLRGWRPRLCDCEFTTITGVDRSRDAAMAQREAAAALALELYQRRWNQMSCQASSIPPSKERGECKPAASLTKLACIINHWAHLYFMPICSGHLDLAWVLVDVGLL